MLFKLLKKKQRTAPAWQAKIKAKSEAYARRASQYLQRRADKIPLRRVKIISILIFLSWEALYIWILFKAIFSSK